VIFHLILAVLAFAMLYQLARMLLFITLWLALQPVRLVLTLMMWAIAHRSVMKRAF
jgi:hypothetical protein